MTQGFFGFNQKEKPASTVSAELAVEGLGKFAIGTLATVGRSPDSHVVLKLPSVSRNHARIFYEGGHYWIKDLDSANGITVNGKPAKLQMLSDRDIICFGEAKSIFRTSLRAGGPAPIGQDPLAGDDIPIPDGTPTGGLADLPRHREAAHEGATAGVSSRSAATAAVGDIQSLRSEIESLRKENETLRDDLAQMRDSATSAPFAASTASEQDEINRLRILVSRLERALADSNQRLRNLQQKLEGKS